MTTLLMTGFPGFLGSALLPRLLGRRPGVDAVCLVQDRPPHDRPGPAGPDRGRASRTSPGGSGWWSATSPHPGSGSPPADRGVLDDVTEVWHLAAVYDLAVGEEVARRVNVVGTDRSWTSAGACRTSRRLHHVSTCYVSGRHAGTLPRGRPRGRPDLPQPLRVHQARVRAAGAQGDGRRPPGHHLPPGRRRGRLIAPGRPRSTTVPTSSRRSCAASCPVAVVPRVADPDRVRFCLVPRDFVIDAMDRLSVLEESAGPDVRPHRPRPADRRASSSTPSPAGSTSGSCGCRSRCR